MRALLLAAGLGTRLGAITEQIPKCLVPIGEDVLLGIWLRSLERAGCGDVLVNLHHRPDQVLRFVNGWEGEIRIHTAMEEQLLGSLGTLAENRDFCAAEPSLLVAYADNLTDIRIRNLMEFHAGHEYPATMAVFEASVPEDCGIAEADEQGVLVRFVEKPQNPATNYANAGVYVFDSDLVRDLESRPGEVRDIGHHLLPELAGKLVIYREKFYLQDIGTPEGYRSGQEYYGANRRSFIAD